MTVLDRATQLGFATLTDVGITVDPAATRLLDPAARGLGVAVAGGVLEVVTDHIPTGAELATWEHTSGCAVTVRIAEPHHFEHLAASAARDGGRPITDLLTLTSDAVQALALHVGHPPLASTAKGFTDLPWPALNSADVDAFVEFLPPKKAGTLTWAKRRWSYTVVNANGSAVVSLRRLPTDPLPLPALGLPAAAAALAGLRHGLVLISSPAGQGRSTTLAALTDRVLTTRTDLVASIDDVGGTLDRATGTRVRIALGTDAPDIAEGVTQAVALGARVITIDATQWSARDVTAMLNVANSGVLVLVAAPGTDLPHAVSTLFAAVPDTLRAGALSQLAQAFEAGLAQALLAGVDGSAVTAAALWWSTPGLVAALRSGDFSRLEAAATSGPGKGTNTTLRRAVTALLEVGRISDDAAAPYVPSTRILSSPEDNSVPAGWDANDPDNPAQAWSIKAPTVAKRRTKGRTVAETTTPSRLEETLDR